MASVQSSEKEVKDLIRSDTSEHSQKSDTNSVDVKVDNPNSFDEKWCEHSPVPNKKCLVLTRVSKPLRYLIYLCLLPVVYVCATVVTVSMLPLLLAAFVIARLLQFVISKESVNKHFQFKVILQYWISVAMLSFLVEAGLFYVIAKYVPQLKFVSIIGLPITKWIKVFSMLIGIYLLSQVVRVFIYFILLRLVSFGEDEGGIIVSEAASEIVGCLLFRLGEAVILNNITTLKQSKIFGVYTKKWIEVSLFVLIGYNIITLLIHLVVWSLPRIYGGRDIFGGMLNKEVSFACYGEVLGKGSINRRYMLYVAYGMKNSIISILSAVMLLLTWVLYFGKELETSHKRVFIFGTWTIISFLLFCFLWLIKSCLLLYWDAHTAYNRLHYMMGVVGRHLYFLVLLSEAHFTVPQNLQGTSNNKSNETKAIWVLFDGELEYKWERKKIREVLVNGNYSNLSVYDVQQIVERLLMAQYTLSDKMSLNHLRDNCSLSGNGVNIELLARIILADNATYWEDDLQLFLSLSDCDQMIYLTFEMIEIWMVRAHSVCRFLANTLTGEKEAAKCVNQIISWFIISATFIIWLLVTGLATTNVLVLISTPLLAASFIFGDTSKSLFQGLVMFFVVRPFECGDLCLIDKNLFEVKTIGVRSTIFLDVRSVGKQHEVAYTHQDLATKNVINYKREFDWKDYIEFSLSSPDKKTIKNLKHKIITYLDSKAEKFVPNFHSVEFLEIGETDKIAVHFKHNVQSEDRTYFECLKEKERLRFKFALYIRDLLNQPEFRKKTPDNTTAEISVDMGKESTGAK